MSLQNMLSTRVRLGIIIMYQRHRKRDEKVSILIAVERDRITEPNPSGIGRAIALARHDLRG